MKRLSISIAGLALSCAPALTQTAAPSFAAASIKPAQMTGQGAAIDRHPGILLMRNVTLQDCIRKRMA